MAPVSKYYFSGDYCIKDYTVTLEVSMVSCVMAKICYGCREPQNVILLPDILARSESSRYLPLRLDKHFRRALSPDY
jgi:hypothetical protein